MSERYHTMPPLAGGQPAAPIRDGEVPAFVRRANRGDFDKPLSLGVEGPAPSGQPPVAALLEISDQVIERLSASNNHLCALADRYLGPQPHIEADPLHRGLAWDDGLAVQAVRKLELILSLATLIDRRIEVFERL